MNRPSPKKSNKFKINLSEKEQESFSVEYCDVCFLAFGSQEPRLKQHNKTIHKDCSGMI